MNIQKPISSLLIVALLTSPLSLFAQGSGSITQSSGDILSTISWVEEPSQTTIFLTDPDNIDTRLTNDSLANTYYSEQTVNFSEDEASQTLSSLDQWVDELRDQIRVLDKKYGLTDEQYLATRKEVVSIINEIEKTKDILAASLTKISFYQKNILKSADQIKDIRASLDETKDYIKNFAIFMYKINNEYYDNQWNIDELKLFIKSDGNVSEQLANTAMVEQVMDKMNTLVETLTVQEKETVTRIKESNKNRANTRWLIADYQDRLRNLQDQKKFLADYLKLYESNKQKMAKEFGWLFDTRADVHRSIITTLAQLKKWSYDGVSFDVTAKLEELKNTKAYALRDEKAAPLSWPLYPVVGIDRFFWDEEYEKSFGISYYGIEVPAPQRTPLYSVDEGLVYKIANKEWVWLNWMLIIHKNNVMSLYLYPNELVVAEGDIVRRGQFIWYSGWEPGTRWAWFVAGGPNLTFMVVDNYEFKNPLDYLDLSVLQNKSNLPSGYKYKYLSDKYNLPRDKYAIKPIEWNSISERRENFLKTYGVSVYRDPQFWIDASEWTNIDPDVGICIAFAESSLGNNMTTARNIGNVGNNDRGDRVSYASPIIWARLIYSTLNNTYLGDYNILLDYNGYGNKEGKIYASSEYNRQNNVTRCLSMIKWYPIPDDFPVRVGLNPKR